MVRDYSEVEKERQGRTSEPPMSQPANHACRRPQKPLRRGYDGGQESDSVLEQVRAFTSTQGWQRFAGIKGVSCF